MINIKKSSVLNTDEEQRYSRQILLSEFTEESQNKLKSAKILVIGAGGLGSPCLIYLAASGIGTIGIIDSDTVDISNLHRQIIHQTTSIGLNKAESAKIYISNLNPLINVITYAYGLTQENGLEICSKYDMIIDCCDNPETRYLSNDISVLLNKPFISGAAIRWDGQFSLYVKNNKNKRLPCYRCIHPIPPSKENIKKCRDVGVLGTIPGVIGTLMANEAIKYFSELKCDEDDNTIDMGRRLFIFDGLNFKTKVASTRDCREDCIICGKEAIININNFKKYNYQKFIENK